jgi:hypothetical protein
VQTVKAINLARTPFKKYKKCIWNYNKQDNQFLAHKDNYTLLVSQCLQPKDA